MLNCFKATPDHSASLMAELDTSIETCLSGAWRILPHLRQNIVKGVTNGIAEAQATLQFAQWSEHDKDMLMNIILHNVEDELAESAHDTTASANLYELRKSLQELHSRFDALLPPTTTQHSIHSEMDDAVSTIGVANGIGSTKIRPYSATIKIHIRHQKSVNRLEGEDTRRLGEAISDSIETFLSSEGVCGSVRLSAANLLDSGDVSVVVNAKDREDLERLIETTAWHGDFERSLGPLSIQSYNVTMHNMRSGCMLLRNRKEKSSIIRTLGDSNFPTDSSGIDDISWCDHNLARDKAQATSAMMVVFSSQDQANKALLDGLLWQGTRHSCTIADQPRSGLERCLNCQKYGHLSDTSIPEPQCGNCAGKHLTDDCTFDKMKCAVCDKAHSAACWGCQIRQKRMENQGLPITQLSPVMNSIAEIHNAIKMEPMPDPTRSEHPKSGPAHKDREDSISGQRARTAHLRCHPSIRQKRQAEDHVLETEYGGHSKRIKQEELEPENVRLTLLEQEDVKREELSHGRGQMAMWRQPSPFIVVRSQ